jgi:outer membrane protein OmpA-like peptidoglycan-associated protein
MRSVFNPISTICAFVLLVGCATVPKPQELLDLEVLREGEQFKEAQDKQAELIAEAEEAYKKAVTAWEGEELEDAKHWSHVGSIKIRTALTLIAQQATRQRIEQAKAQLGQTQATYADLSAKIKEADEQLRLHGELNAAKRAAANKEAKLKAELDEQKRKQEEEKRLAEAQQIVAKAQLAVKMADTVDAATYAKSDYSVALTMLKKAEAALKVNKASEASAMAEAAKNKAEAAFAAAKPKFSHAKASAERKAKNQALQKDASAIAGVTVRMKTVGETQQLILPVPNLFKRYKTTPRGEKMGILNAIGALLKKYPGYPVIINGYTSYRVRRSQRFAVSQARAQQIASHFSTMGVPFKRFAVSGRGAENLIARKWSRLNDRVEVIILFQ